MQYLADLRDSPECAVTVDGEGRFDFGPEISNPSMSCPDAFAWKIFTEAVRGEFWSRWTTDVQMWPTAPWPVCEPGQTENCCSTVEVSNNPDPEHCPVRPDPALGMPAHTPHEPGKAHQVSMEDAAKTDRDGDGSIDWDDVPPELKTAVIGAEQVELVYHNRPMTDYIFANGLYHTDGLGRVFQTRAGVMEHYAPYNGVAGTGPLSQIDLPIRSLMLKANLLDIRKAKELGIDLEKNADYITLDLPKGGNTPETGTYILLSFHISSKDLPNWFWTTFEHVDNQGRCDWIGCNDSFGYVARVSEGPTARDDLPEPADNYVSPNQLEMADGAVVAFDLARTYDADSEMRDGLAAVFKTLGIGTGAANESGTPRPADPAWRNYRLKGSQTNFVTPTGRPTQLGNSVTEAGFTNSSSCISCHARASATEKGLPNLSIFVSDLSDAGLPKSTNGVPAPSWFTTSAYYGVGDQVLAPGLVAVQTDFVWGFRNACPIEVGAQGPHRCAKKD